MLYFIATLCLFWEKTIFLVSLAHTHTYTSNLLTLILKLFFRFICWSFIARVKSVFQSRKLLCRIYKFILFFSLLAWKKTSSSNSNGSVKYERTKVKLFTMNLIRCHSFIIMLQHLTMRRVFSCLLSLFYIKIYVYVYMCIWMWMWRKHEQKLTLIATPWIWNSLCSFFSTHLLLELLNSHSFFVYFDFGLCYRNETTKCHVII